MSLDSTGAVTVTMRPKGNENEKWQVYVRTFHGTQGSETTQQPRQNVASECGI